MNSAAQIAEYIIAFRTRVNKPITRTELQILLYYVQGYSYKYLDSPIFKDQISAGVYGPYIENINLKYEPYFNYPMSRLSNKEIEHAEIVNKVIYDFADFFVWDLIDKCRSEYPWTFTFHNPSSNLVISEDIISKFFKTEYDFKEEEK